MSPLQFREAQYEASLPGVRFHPSVCLENHPNITPVYKTVTNATAYIEDYYNIGVPTGMGGCRKYPVEVQCDSRASRDGDERPVEGQPSLEVREFGA